MDAYPEMRHGMKKWWKSKTVWFNVVTGIIVIADQLSGKAIPVEVSAVIVSVGNVILRLITNKAVTK